MLDPDYNLEAFALRPSELASTPTGAVYLGVVVEGDAGGTLQPAIPLLDGYTAVASSIQGNTAFALYRVDRAALQQLEITGANGSSGAYTLSMFVAGDVNRDGLVDGLDTQASTAAFGSVAGDANFNTGADFNRDGQVNATDRQLLAASYGYRANQAPTVQATSVKTHEDLEVDAPVGTFLSDLEGDSTYYRITGATHGTALLSGDGQSVLFTPEAGFSGEASFSIVADDGYSVSPEATVTVNVSDAQLVKLHFDRIASLSQGSMQRVHITGDFADEKGVALAPSYLQFASSDAAVADVSANGVLRAKSEGTALLTASSHGIQAVNAIGVYPVVIPDPDGEAYSPDPIDPGVYPGTLTLTNNGGKRQLSVTSVDGEDITAAASGTVYFVGNPDIATITPDGLVVGLAEGVTTLSIVNAAGQVDIELKVQVPSNGPTLVTAADGGAVQGSDGSLVMVGPGALASDATVSIAPVDLANVGMPLPAPNVLDALGAFQLDLGPDESYAPVQLAVPVTAPIDPATGLPKTYAAGTEVLFLQKGTIADEMGVLHDTWWIVDNGHLDADGIARTASLPYPGIVLGGTMLVVATNPLATLVAAQAALGSWDAAWAPSGLISMAGYVGAAASTAMTAIANATDSILSVFDYSSDGTTRAEVPITPTIDGNYTIDVPIPPTRGPTKNPEISSVDYNADTGELEIRGDFGGTQSVAGATVWLRVTIEPKVDGVLKEETLAPDRGLIKKSYKLPYIVGSDEPLRITLPEGVALSQLTVRVERAGAAVTPGTTSPDWSNAVSGMRVSLAHSRSLSVVTNSSHVYLYQETVNAQTGKKDLVLVKTLYTDEHGGALVLNGYRTDQIAFASGGDLCFIAGRDGRIYMLDMTSMEIVHTIRIEGGGNISSLAVAEGWLYVAEGERYGGGPGRLLRVDLRMRAPDESGRFLSVQSLSGLPAATSGYLDLAVSGNRYLAVTAPAQVTKYSRNGNGEKGNVYVIDLRTNLDSETSSIHGYRTIDLEDLGEQDGQGPQFIAPGARPGEFLLTDALDHSAGFVSIDFDLRANGELPEEPVLRHMSLIPPGGPRWVENVYHQNIQRTHGIVYAYVDGAEYAIVADFNIFTNDPSFAAEDADEKHIGGKIGVIKDPFGRNGAPQYLGATTPIEGGQIDKLAISGDGEYLYANVVRDQSTGGNTSRLSQSLYVWDAKKLVRSALAAYTAKVSPAKPFDQGVLGAQPILQRDSADGTSPFDWIFGIAAPVDRSQITADPVRYGDVSKIDLFTLIRNADSSLSGFGREAFTDFQIDTSTVALAQIVTDPKTQRVIAEDSQGKSADVANTGIFYLAPNIGQKELEKLRRGDRLGDVTATVSFTVTVNGEQKSFKLDVPVVDFASAGGQSQFFGDRDLANPGYSEFTVTSEVGVGSGNALDVWRVEQRLKYFGFSTFNYPTSNGFSEGYYFNPLTPLEFTVDGAFGEEERTALTAFFAETHYKNVDSGIAPTTAISGTGTVSTSAGNGKENLLWLNAYNAPHWMNVYQSLGISYGSVQNDTAGNFQDGTSKIFEVYSTSWTRDLLKAWEIERVQLGGSDTGLYQFANRLTINALSDPGYAFDTHSKGGHSIGMAIDLGVGLQWIDRTNQRFEDPFGTGNNPDLFDQLAQVPGSGWSVARAKQLSALLPDDMAGEDSEQPADNQREALRDFLALYALTQRDTDPSNPVNGTREEIPVKNGEAARSALFGAGDTSGGLISRVYIGGESRTVTNKDGTQVLDQQNPFVNMNLVLMNLGIDSTNKRDHQNHFHIFLRAPERVRIEPANNLLADNAASGAVEVDAGEELRAAAQALLAQVQPYLDFKEGDVTMFVMDVPPDVPPQYAPVVIAQAGQAKDSAGIDRTIGVCHLIDARPELEKGAVNVFSPQRAVQLYSSSIESLGVAYAKGTTVLLQGPTHGQLKDLGTVVMRHGSPFDTGYRRYAYRPAPDYIGPDQATFLVEMGGVKVKVIYHFNVMSQVPGGTEGYDPYRDEKNCPNGETWKISLNPDDPATGEFIYNYAQPLTTFFADAPQANLNIADLSGGAVGQTIGNTITLDTDGAGYGWFIDSTPHDNSEFLPTSNPNEWIARPGSDAAGKMDMLTVLMHEYGHVLGLDHSQAAHDLMSESLQPGVRHTFSAEDTRALLNALGDTAPTDPNAPLPPTLPLGLPLVFGLGRMRLRGAGADPQGIVLPPLSTDTKTTYVATPAPVYRMQPLNETALHTGLYNGDFAQSDPTNSQFGWQTRGGVSLAGGELTLTEADRTMSGVTQTFVKPDGIVGLRFTIDGAQFATDGSAPPDAFEVALLDALTGQSVAGTAPLSGTDAFLNIQSDGRSYASGSVTVKHQPITAGSPLSFTDPIRVTVDLSNVQAGTPLKLYFDLLGMGAAGGNAGSSVRIDNVELLTNFNTEPQAADDAATTAEDTAVTIPVLANDQDAESDPLTVALIALPRHGVLTRNADGSFSYTADANFNGSDSFTYKVNDGEFDSNVATVNISVTPVNDAPVANDVQAPTLEDTALVLDLRASATDMDSTGLSALIVDGPANGKLTANADGTVTYTPNANFNGTDTFTYKVNDGELDSNLANVIIAVASVNDAPQGAGTTVSTPEDTPYVFQLADFGFSDRNDVPANGFAAVTITALPSVGNLTYNGALVVAGQSITATDIAAGLLQFAPEANANGAGYASLSFRVQDDGGTANGGVNTDTIDRTLVIDVQAVNDAPVAASTQASTLEDTPLALDLRGYASDVDSASLTAFIVSGPANGILSANGDGTLTYTPNADFNGSDSFTYKVNDGALDSNVATVDLSITPVNDAPVATNRDLTAVEDSARSIDLLAQASDTDSTSLSPSIVAAPLHGSVTLNQDGTFTYTPEADYFGTDSFTYKVNDGQLDSNVATVSITVTPVNDAPIASDFQASTLEDNPLVIDLRASASDVDSTNLAALIVNGPANGVLTANADGTFTYTPNPDFNGADTFTYKVNDGSLDSNIATVSLVVTPVNDAPIATDGAVMSPEDTPYVFAWDDFHAADLDSTDLAVVINSLPADGLLQFFDGADWIAVTAGQLIAKSDIDAGLLCFGPDANESGYAGYSTAGYGNLASSYAFLGYQVSDGMLLSNPATMTVTVVPLADAPVLGLMDPPDASGATRERFHTGWESVANRNRHATVTRHSTLEGWRVIAEEGCGYYDDDQGFVVWSSGDRMRDATRHYQTVYAAEGNGRNWLELGDTGGNDEGYGIERLVRTRDLATYTLTFDYAGRLGMDADHTRIGVYLDGVLVGTYANTSPNSALNWQPVAFQFTGNGTLQHLRIRLEGTSTYLDKRGAMLDDILLVEEMPLNTGYSGEPIRLSSIVANLSDTDGSESLVLTVGAIPVGATLTDGTHSFTAATGSTSVDVTAWALDNLSITSVSGFTGSFDLAVSATATEAVTSETAAYAVALTVTVLPANISSPIVIDLNGDGVKTVALEDSSGRFDLLDTGDAIGSGWLSGDDGFLAIDANGNGTIDDRGELFGGAVGEGYAKLRSFDSNHDGVVDAKDERFGELKVWQDRNGNHRTDAGDLGSLTDFGIASLSTRYTLAPEEQNGNWLLERGAATKADGTQLEMADAYFELAKPTEKPAAALVRREDEDRSASIIVRSEPAQSVLPLGPDPILLGAGTNRLQGNPPPTIDWSGSSQSILGDETEAKKKDKGRQGWLVEFLGIKSAAKKDLAEQTGLKIVLGEKSGASD